LITTGIKGADIARETPEVAQISWPTVTRYCKRVSQHKTPYLTTSIQSVVTSPSKFVHASLRWKQLQSNWNFNTICRTVTICVCGRLLYWQSALLYWGL